MWTSAEYAPNASTQTVPRSARSDVLLREEPDEDDEEDEENVTGDEGDDDEEMGEATWCRCAVCVGGEG
jgi:hypothetical protein